MDNFLETTLGIFLDSRRVIEKGEICSFTGMGSIKGKFMVKDEDYPMFLDLLHEYLFVQRRRPLNLVEQKRCDLYTPIIIDLDFKYPTERALHRQFELSHIHTFIHGYVQNITHFYNLSEYKPLRFFVTLRPAPYEDKKSNTLNRSIKDGVHIECPDFVLHTEHQQVLRHRSLELNNLSNAFKHTGYINAEKDIFDEAIVKKNGWFFYGESKPDIPAYNLVSVYVYNPKTGEFYEEDTNLYESRQLLELLSIRYNLHVDSIPFNEESQEEWKLRIDLCTGRRAPIIATGGAGARAGDDEEGESTTLTATTTSNNVNEQYEKDKFALVSTLVNECLSVERADSYQSWIEVGWCLHNIDQSEKMFNLWMEFSNKSLKCTGNNVMTLFRDWSRGWHRSQHERHFTIRSLHMWAKQDNPKRYKDIMKDSFIDFVEREVDATHTHIARLMKRMYANNYCASVDSKKVDWFEFNGIYWRKLAQGIELRNKMTTEVAQVISDTRDRMRNRLSKLSDDHRAFQEARMKKMTKIEQCLYTSGFKDSVMKECIGLFYEDEFSQKLNSNQYLIGFNNGVLNLHAIRTKDDGTKEYFVNFRKAEPTDYISFMAGRALAKNCDPIDYRPYIRDDLTDEERRIDSEIDDFMEKVFPRPELRAYMWRKLASCIEGDNKEQTYETWIGVGGNGKTKLVDLMTMVLGDYSTSLQSTAMTRKRPESGAANPDIMAVRNKRFIYMAEPDDREPLNTSRMKQFVGQDLVEARGLFEDQTKFQITGKLFMLCNTFPAINTMDIGTWRRIRVVPFESRFVPPEQLENFRGTPNVYPRDPELDNKIITWRERFMARLVHIYATEYLNKGIGKEPAIILEESKNYQSLFDSTGKFINSRIRVISKGSHEATINDIFRIYKRWYEDVGGGVGRRLSQNDLYKRLCDIYSTPSDKKTFKQVKLFDDDESIEEYDRSLLEGTL